MTLVVSCLLLAGFVVPTAAVAERPLTGKLDRSFGGDGRVFSDLGGALVGSKFTSMVRQPDGMLVLAGSVGSFRATVERREPSGALDEAFGNGGVVKVRKASAVRGLAVLGDGRILFGAPGKGDICGNSTIRRLLPTGPPDPSFGGDGVSAPVPFLVSQLAVDAAGRILVAGSANEGPCGKSIPPTQLAVARLSAGGGLDRSFGDGGVARFGGEDGQRFATGLAVREDGTILVAANRRLLALAADGTLDPRFGTGGVAGVVGSPKALLVLPGGGAVVAGSSSDLGSYYEGCCRHPGDFVLSRYRADGSLDPGFGSGGIARLDLGEVDETGALALQPDGSVVLAGATGAYECPPSECRRTPILARFTASGTLDPGFGASGWTPVGIPGEAPSYGYEPQLSALAIVPDGQIIAAGGAGSFSDAFVVARDPSGQPDPRFGSAGAVAKTSTHPSGTSATGMAVTSGGKILVSASSNAGAHRFRGVLLASAPNGGFDPELDSGDGFVVDETGGVIWAGRGGHVYSLRSGAVTRFDDRGQADPGYGSEGVAHLPQGFRAIALDVRRDGGAVAVGRIANRQGMAAFELTPAGLPRLGFGDRGLALIRFGGTKPTEARSFAIERTGRIVLVGRSGSEAIAARLLPNGHLDRDFAHGGRLRHLPISGLQEIGIALQRGGMLIAGREAGRSQPLSLLRFGRDGARDLSFAHGGILRIEARGLGLSLFASRRQIVLVSARWPGGAGGVVLRAYEPDGAVDKEFGHRGVAAVASPSSRYLRPVTAARQADGRIVVAATSGRISGGADVELLRFR